MPVRQAKGSIAKATDVNGDNDNNPIRGGGKQRLLIVFVIVQLGLAFFFAKCNGLTAFVLSDYIPTTSTTDAATTEASNTSGAQTYTSAVGLLQNNQYEQPQQVQEAANILFGLSGNNENFLLEFEVALKSILLNAPLDHDLNIYIMADDKAYKAMDQVFNRTGILAWKTRRQVTVEAFNVQSHLTNWKQKVAQFFKGKGYSGYSDSGHTIGTWFRLFAHEILPSNVKSVIYVDTDLVFVANVWEVWRLIDRTQYLFQWGADHMCSGFILLHIDQIERIWELAAPLDLNTMAKSLKQKWNDQLVFKAINVSYPEKVGNLPIAWDFSVGHIWQYHKKPGPFAHLVPHNSSSQIVGHRPEVGMMHYNGYHSQPYYRDHPFVTSEARKDTWGLPAIYYSKLPWTWAKYVAASTIGSNGGYPIQTSYYNNQSIV